MLKNIFFGGTKKPLRRIKDIVNCGNLSNKMFFIEIKTSDGKSKQIIYEVKSINTRNEIIAKINYLMVIYISLFLENAWKFKRKLIIKILYKRKFRYKNLNIFEYLKKIKISLYIFALLGSNL